MIFYQHFTPVAPLHFNHHELLHLSKVALVRITSIKSLSTVFSFPPLAIYRTTKRFTVHFPCGSVTISISIFRSVTGYTDLICANSYCQSISICMLYLVHHFVAATSKRGRQAILYQSGMLPQHWPAAGMLLITSLYHHNHTVSLHIYFYHSVPSEKFSHGRNLRKLTWWMHALRSAPLFWIPFARKKGGGCVCCMHWNECTVDLSISNIIHVQVLGGKPVESLCHLKTEDLAGNILLYLKAPSDQEVTEVYIKHLALLVSLHCYMHMH